MRILLPLIVSAITLLSGTGIVSKMSLAGLNDRRHQTGDLYYHQVVAPRLIALGYHWQADHALTNDGNFIARIWSRADCAGYLVILPMPGNAEIAPLLSARFPGLTLYHHILYRGQTHDRFPAFAYWQDRIGAQVKAMTGWQAEEALPVPLGIAASGACRIPGISLARQRI